MSQNNNDFDWKAWLKKNWINIAAAGLLVGWLSGTFNSEAPKDLEPQPFDTMSYSDLLESANRGSVRSMVVDGGFIISSVRGGDQYVTTIPPNSDVTKDFAETGVELSTLPAQGDGQEREQSGGLGSLLFSFGPVLLLIGFWYMMMKKQQGGSAMGFGKSKAKLLTAHAGKVTFDDVAGIDEAKEELEEVVEFLRDPQKYSRLGGKIPKGALLVGPPGTGKTLLARAVAGEAGVPFFSISGSDFVEMFVGVGASRVRDMFEQAKKNAPCIVFVDEIDAMGRKRGHGHGGGNDEREQTLNQMLVEMDGFEANEGVIIMAATNRPDVLDPALLRPGRFDRQVEVPNPDVKGREKILGVHAKKVPLSPDVNLQRIAAGTPGFSGADLANLVNEAALAAARADKKMVRMEDFEIAKDKVMMGTERKSMLMLEKDKIRTARHEVGHAIVGYHYAKLKLHDPVRKATIIPRGRALGMVLSYPDHDRVSMTEEEYEAKMSMAMAGRAAERLEFGDKKKITSGPASDIQQVTKIAKAMVSQFGMSEELGSVNYAPSNENPYEITCSEATRQKIDEEVREKIVAAEEDAYKLLNETYAEQWNTMTELLLKHETLNQDQIAAIMEGKDPFPPEPDKPDTPEQPTGAHSTVPVVGKRPSGGPTPA